ncbi:hypothetical protein BP5796_03640 [Coleophoma crateriformis]|uniref:Aldoxime dehydratase n=1 Tax=Coleophoma crateriformis TaxID=565419 RepID=A0A3D8SNS6_9HELO|nr:hypothetical protein BP5796_03640 [Coleophoma crateriformis]
MYRVTFPESPIVYSIFGVQYVGDKPNENKQILIDTFDKLIHSSPAKKIENLEEDTLSEGKSRIWLAYWISASSYESWWQTPDVVNLWATLPADAGMWREILTVPKGRLQQAVTQQTNEGLVSVGKDMVPYTDKTGYWGCYRDRYTDATPENRMDSPLKTIPEAQASSLAIRPGRVRMAALPDNLSFVVEGQDHSSVPQTEKDHWFENFDAPVTKWINHLTGPAGHDAGMLKARVCYAPSSGQYRDALPKALNYNRKIQLFYFLDHGYMERSGKKERGHVDLRTNFMKSYCPAGIMGQVGKLLLWVETCILKGNEMECEYVGCWEGTGFLAYDQHKAFRSADAAKSSKWFGIF